MGSNAEGTSQKYMAQYDAMNPNRDKYNSANIEALNAYRGAASGNAPSVAQEQLKQTTQQNIANQASMAASGRGRDPAAAQRQAAYNSALAGQMANQSGALLRADEMEKGRAGLAGISGGNLQRMDTGRANMGNMGVEVGKQQDSEREKLFHGISDSGAGRMVGQGIQSGVGALMMMSDEKLKKDIGSGAAKIDHFLDSIKAYAFKYKDGVDAPKGEHVSPMAQDLEKSSMGKDMVEDTPSGKVVDYARGFGAMLAAQAHLNDRLNKLEKKRAS